MLLEIIKNTENFKLLEREYNNNSFSKALLLIGKDETYLHEFSIAVSMLLLDGKIDEKSSNSVKILSGSHPDVKQYPLKDKLLVSDSEEIVDESFVKPILADKKVFIIHNIDNSMEAAQNKLLKVLEEPSKNVYMILTCTAPDLVLPTIKSRCIKLELNRLSDEQISPLLPYSEIKPLILAVADGRVGKAIEYSKDKSFESLCKDCLEIFTKMKSSKDVLAHSKKLLGYKNQDLVLQVLAQIDEDLIRIKSRINPTLPFKDELSSVLNEYTVRALCEISKLLDKCAKERLYNVNTTIALENLLLNMLEVKYLCR